MTTTAQANWKDGFGNTLRLSVRDGRVRLCNQHRVSLSLSTVMFLADHHDGCEAKARALRDAVKACKTSEELVHTARLATRISGWTVA